MTASPRRSQKERREESIAKLLDATIDCLIDQGYRDTSIARICERAGLSHGGLFRHFSSRTALIAAATDEVGRRHLRQLRRRLNRLPTDRDPIDNLVRSFRESAQAPLSSAWREVLLAARTNEDLCAAVSPALKHFETAIMEIAGELPGAPADRHAFGTLILSILHMFDSEAMAAAVLHTQDIIDQRHRWAVEQLRQALEVQPSSRTKPPSH